MSKINVDDIRNPFEVGIYKQLKAAVKGSKIEDLGYESTKLTYVTESYYVPDFVVTLKDGHTVYIESKGYFRPEDKRKMLAVKKYNPDLDIRMLFQKDNKFPRSKTTYSMWSTKHGFPWAIGEIPKEWFT